MEDTSVVEEDTKSPGSETLPHVITSSSSQPRLTSNVCPTFVNGTHDKDASMPSTPILYENKPMNPATTQTGNSDGLVQITTIQALDKPSKLNVPLLGMSKSATFATSPHVSSTPVRVVTLQKVASPSVNRQPSSPQGIDLTTPPSRVTTPQSPQHVLHLTANQGGSPCYTKVFQCSPGSRRVGQPQVARPSNLPTTVTVLRGTGATILVNGVPATCVTTMTSPYVINASPSKDTRNKHGQVKRPMNAFMVWARHYRQTLSRQMVHASNADVSVLLGRIWNNMSDDNKRPFYEEAETLKMQHKVTHPGWVYKPHKQRTWDPVTTAPSSPNLTGSPIITLHSGSNSTESTPTKIYHHTTALQSPIIMNPRALTPTASPFKEPGKVSYTRSPQHFTCSSPQLDSMPRSPVMRASPASLSQSSPQLGSMPRSPVMSASPTSHSQSSPQLGPMPRSPVMRASPASLSQSSPQLGSMPRSPVITANHVSLSQSSPQLGSMPRSPVITANHVSLSQSSPQLGSMLRSPVITGNHVSLSQSSPQLGSMSRSPVMRANPASLSQSSSQLGCMHRSPIIRANTISISQSSPHQGSVPRSPLMRASPVSVSQMISTMPRAVIAHQPFSSSITYRSNQPVQVNRGSGMVAGAPANTQTASIGMSAQGSITIRNSSGVCQTVPVRIGFRPTLRPVIVAPAATSAVPLGSSLTTLEQPSTNHLQYNFISTNNLTSTTTSNPSVGQPSALGQPPSSSLRNIVAMARTILPVTQTHTTSTPVSVTNLTVCHTPPSTKTIVRNESQPSVSKKPPPLLPIYSSTNNCVGTGTMRYQPAFVPITIPQILTQKAQEKPDASVSAMGQKYGTVRESVELKTSVQMSNWSAVTKGTVQQSPGQSLAERTSLGLTQDLKNRVVVSACPVQQSPGNLKYQTNLPTTIPHQSWTFPLPKTNLQNPVYSTSTTQTGLSTTPTYSIRAPIHSPAIISREHSYPRREYQIQGQGQFRAATEDQVKFTPVSSVKQIEPEWWCLPFSPYPLDDLLQQEAQGANARPFAKVTNEDNGSGDDGKAGEEANDDVQFYGKTIHWQDYCDPYNPAYFDSSNTQAAELCGNIPSLNMQRWTSYLEGLVTEDKDSILGEPTIVPNSNQSTHIAGQRSVIGDQKTFINTHKGLVEDPVFIQQCPVPVHTQSQLNQIPGQCQFIPDSGPLSRFVRGGRTYHVLQQQCSVPREAGAHVPQPAATSGGDNLVPAKLCLPPRKKTRQH